MSFFDVFLLVLFCEASLFDACIPLIPTAAVYTLFNILEKKILLFVHIFCELIFFFCSVFWFWLKLWPTHCLSCLTAYLWVCVACASVYVCVRL